jgi:hypothetical protein
MGADSSAGLNFGAEGALEDLELDFLGHDFHIVYGEDHLAILFLALDADRVSGGCRLQGVLDHVAKDSIQELPIGNSYG